jgi:PhzF family phenazine biosynthesis protein
MERRFVQIDVFGARPYTGNPLAVVIDAQGLTEEQMLELARWTNLSETSFLLSPDSRAADYRVRIFTVAGELPFAGHPTLGSCHAWLSAGGQPRSEVVVQECGIGLVKLRRAADLLSFEAPPLIRSGPVDEDHLAFLAGGLGLRRDDILDAAWIDNGAGWLAFCCVMPRPYWAWIRVSIRQPPRSDWTLASLASTRPGQSVRSRYAGYSAPRGASCARTR